MKKTHLAHYLILFENIYILINRGLIDNKIAKSLYEPRLKRILKNTETKSFFMKEPKNWDNLIDLVKKWNLTKYINNKSNSINDNP